MSIASRINEMTEHLKNDWNSINKLGLKAKKLPDEYKQVEYIESGAAEYIDTGFVPNQNTRTVIDFTPISSDSSSVFIFGARVGYNSNGYDLYAFGPKFRDDYANTNYGNESSQPFPKLANKRYLFDKNKNHSTMYEENVQFYDHTFTERAINLSFNMFLFGVNNNGSVASSNMARMKLYSCKIYDDDTPIRDFVPCYRINDVKVGLYDTINDVFYTNQGAGAFTYGEIQEEIPNKNIKNIAPVLDRFYNQLSDKTNLSENGIVGSTSQNPTLPTDYTRVDYIESSGSQYINTGHYPSSNNDKLEIETSYIGGDTTSCLFGAYANGSYYQLNKTTTANQFRIITRTGDILYTFEDYASKHTYLLEGNKLYIDNIEIATGSGTVDFSSQTLYLFARNYSGEASQFGSWRIYSCKIKTNNILVRDFIPCYRNSDNEVGLYDLVNNVFYTNQGTGAFTYGTIVTEPSPDYPLNINNLSGDVEYKVRGKNLFDTSLLPLTKNGITITKNDKGEIVIDGTPNISSGYITFQVGNISTSELTTYTSSIDNKRDGLGVSVGNGNINLPMGETYASKTFTFNYTFTINPTINIRYDAGTFDNVVINPQLEKNTTKTDYEPYISESFPLSLKSRNLFDKDNANVLVGYISGGAKIISEKNDRIIYIPCKPNTTYILQKMVQEPLSMNRFRVATSETEPTYGMVVNQFYNPGDGKNIEKYIITTNDRANYLIFYCYYVLNNETTFEEILSSIQIEEGSTPTDYEPYYDIELCNISDYKDRIYSQNGEFYLEKKTVKVVLDGSETYSSFSNNRFRTPITISGGDGYRTTICICNLLKGSNQSELGTTQIENAVAINSAYAWIRITSSTTEQELKTLLQNTNAIVYYVLASSTTENITSENYPTLYSQLLAIQEFLTKYKINKEFLLNYSSLEIIINGEIQNPPSETGIDWSTIGYDETPQAIKAGYDYAKSIYDSWDSTKTSMASKYNGNREIMIMPLVDTSNVTSMASCFDGAYGLSVVPLLDTSKVTTMYSTFSDCRALQSVPALNTSRVTTMQNMFKNCYALKTIPLFDTSSISNSIAFNAMFNNCIKLTDESLDNLLQMCVNATGYPGTKTLYVMGIINKSAYPVSRIEALPHYQDFIDAGWTIGY